MFQVSLRTLLEITALVAFILAIWYLRAENKSGQYQLTVHGPSSRLYVIDSTTGQVWVNNDSGNWEKSSSLPAP